MSGMASDKILKKTLFGGFDKEKVLIYVEKLQAEILELKKELSTKTAESENAASLLEENNQLKKELEEKKEENNMLSQENDALLKANAEYELRMEEFKANEKEYLDMIEACNAQFAEVEKQFAEMEELYKNRGMVDFQTAYLNRQPTKASEEIAEVNEKLRDSFSSFEAVVEKLQNTTDEVENAFKSFEEMFAKANIEDMMS